MPDNERTAEVIRAHYMPLEAMFNAYTANTARNIASDLIDFEILNMPDPSKADKDRAMGQLQHTMHLTVVKKLRDKCERIIKHYEKEETTND